MCCRVLVLVGRSYHVHWVEWLIAESAVLKKSSCSCLLRVDRSHGGQPFAHSNNSIVVLNVKEESRLDRKRNVGSLSSMSSVKLDQWQSAMVWTVARYVRAFFFGQYYSYLAVDVLLRPHNPLYTQYWSLLIYTASGHWPLVSKSCRDLYLVI